MPRGANDRRCCQARINALPMPSRCYADAPHNTGLRLLTVRYTGFLIMPQTSFITLRGGKTGRSLSPTMRPHVAADGASGRRRCCQVERRGPLVERWHVLGREDRQAAGGLWRVIGGNTRRSHAGRSAGSWPAGLRPGGLAAGLLLAAASESCQARKRKALPSTPALARFVLTLLPLDLA